MSRAISSRERALEVRVAELEAELAAWRANEDDAARWSARELAVHRVQRRLAAIEGVDRHGHASGAARILLELLARPGRLRSNLDLFAVQSPRGADHGSTAQSVTVYLSLLRKGLRLGFGLDGVVQTVRGHGYVIEPADAARIRAALELDV